MFFEGLASCLELLIPNIIRKFRIAQCGYSASHSRLVFRIQESFRVEVKACFRLTPPLLQDLAMEPKEIALGGSVISQDSRFKPRQGGPFYLNLTGTINQNNITVSSCKGEPSCLEKKV